MGWSSRCSCCCSIANGSSNSNSKKATVVVVRTSQQFSVLRPGCCNKFPRNGPICVPCLIGWQQNTPRWAPGIVVACITTWEGARTHKISEIVERTNKRSQRMKQHTKWHVRPAKTQISLGIRPVWSESSLCAKWVAKDLRFLNADSEDSDQTGQMPRLIWVLAWRTGLFVGFVMRWLKSCLKRTGYTL